MKLTKQTLKRIIKEELDEAYTEISPDLSVDQTDPNDGLFRIMDQVGDRAMEMMGTTLRQLTDNGDDSDFMKMSNEVVSARLEDVDGMARELVEKFEARRAI